MADSSRPVSRHSRSQGVGEAFPAEVIKTSVMQPKLQLLHLWSQSLSCNTLVFLASTVVFLTTIMHEVYNTPLHTIMTNYSSTCTSQIPFTSLQFPGPLYEILKHRLSTYLYRKPLHAHEASVCGSITRGTAASLTTPLDVHKTRVMFDLIIGPCRES
jgi:hypothetical protein